MNKINYFIGVATISILFQACSPILESIRPSKTDINENSTPVEVPIINNATSCASTVSNFYAGQHYLAGTITVKNDANNIYVTFNTIDGWVMGQTHLYVGSLSGIPVGNSGNPNIGRFPYKTAHSENTTNFTYTIPRSAMGSQTCIIVASHAEVSKKGPNGQVQQQETAWGAGKAITPGGSWATYFDYCLCNETSTGGSTTGGTTSGSTSGGTTSGSSTTGGTTSGTTSGSTTSGSTTSGSTTSGGTTSGSTTSGSTTTGGTTSGSTTSGSTTSGGTTTSGSTTSGGTTSGSTTTGGGDGIVIPPDNNG